MDIFNGIFSKNWYEKQIRLAKKHGADEGKHGRPAPNSSSPDKFEIDFVSSGLSLILKANSQVTEFIKKTNPLIQEANSKLDDIEAESRNRVDLDSLRNKVHSIKNDARTPLTNTYTKVIETDGYLRAFKVTHNVSNVPDYPDDAMHFLSIVFIVLIFEGCLNAFFWKNDSGLLGGFFIALAVAGVNICFAMLIGMLVRYMHYKKIWALVLAISALIIGFVGVGLLNIWIATVRSMHHLNKLTTPDLASVFQDSTSVLLLFVGLFFAIIAAYKGYYLFGSVPGYEKVHKDFEKASADAAKKEKALKSEIDSSISTERNKLTQLLRNLSETNKSLNRIKADVKSTKENFNATAEEIVESTKLIVQNYRTNNSQSRPSNIPSPSYFKDEIDMDYQIISTFSGLENSATQVSERSDEMVTSITSSINEELHAISSFKAQELGPVVEDFIQEIKLDAEQNFIKAIPKF